MNHVVIFFVPEKAGRKDFEAALHEHFEQVEISDVAQAQPPHHKVPVDDKMPLWTWFLPERHR